MTRPGSDAIRAETITITGHGRPGFAEPIGLATSAAPDRPPSLRILPGAESRSRSRRLLLAVLL